jgi:hypothetical protein
MSNLLMLSFRAKAVTDREITSMTLLSSLFLRQAASLAIAVVNCLEAIHSVSQNADILFNVMLSSVIANFMDYSPDECLSEFTPGQIERIRDQIRTYRGKEDA